MFILCSNSQGSLMFRVIHTLQSQLWKVTYCLKFCYVLNENHQHEVSSFLQDFCSSFLLCLPLQRLKGSLPRSNNTNTGRLFENPNRLNVTRSSSLKRSRDVKISTTGLGWIIVNPLLGWSESDLQRALANFSGFLYSWRSFTKSEKCKEEKKDTDLSSSGPKI